MALSSPESTEAIMEAVVPPQGQASKRVRAEKGPGKEQASTEVLINQDGLTLLPARLYKSQLHNAF